MIKSNYYYACIHSFLGMTVHCKDCRKLQKKGQVFLGSFYEYHQAVAVAKRRYTDINQCSDCLNGKYCTPEPVVALNSVKPEAKHEGSTVRTRICGAPPVTVKAKVEPVRMCQKPEARLSPVFIPELKAKGNGNVNRVPRKHSPGND